MDYISLLGRIYLLSRTPVVRQRLDLNTKEEISSPEGRQIQIGTMSFLSRASRVRQGLYLFFQGLPGFSLGQLESDKDQISLIRTRSLLYRTSVVRSRLYLFTTEEIFSLQGSQDQIETRSLHQGGDLFCLGPVESVRDQLSFLGRIFLLSKATWLRQRLSRELIS